MAKFKSTAHHAVRVVHYDPRKLLLRRSAFILAFLLVATVTGAGGWYFAQDRQLAMMKERSEMSTVIKKQDAELQDLRHQVTVLSRGNLVERQASETVRREVRALNEKIYGLEKEITFYRNIMSPGASADKLRIQRLDLTGRQDAPEVRFKLVLTQVSEKRELISGSVQFELIGKSDGESMVLDATELGLKEDIPFQFRYFQELEGEFALPADFVPTSMRVKARSAGRKPIKVVREFTWLLQEAGTNVRQG